MRSRWFIFKVNCRWDVVPGTLRPPETTREKDPAFGRFAGNGGGPGAGLEVLGALALIALWLEAEN